MSERTPATNQPHETTVVEIPGGTSPEGPHLRCDPFTLYFAACVCGFRSDPVVDRGRAVEVGEQHAASGTSVPEPDSADYRHRVAEYVRAAVARTYPLDVDKLAVIADTLGVPVESLFPPHGAAQHGSGGEHRQNENTWLDVSTGDTSVSSEEFHSEHVACPVFADDTDLTIRDDRDPYVSACPPWCDRHHQPASQEANRQHVGAGHFIPIRSLGIESTRIPGEKFKAEQSLRAICTYLQRQDLHEKARIDVDIDGDGRNQPRLILELTLDEAQAVGETLLNMVAVAR